jgi:hypothetical protein
MKTAEWHLKGIVGDVTSECLVVGTKDECTDIANFMIGKDKWDCAWLYPPGSDSGEMATDIPENKYWSVHKSMDDHSVVFTECP